MLTAVILAGGRGERFWPLSRKGLPKQFINLLGEGTMLQITVQRVRDLVDIDHVFVVTSAEYAPIVAEQLPELPKANILIEPEGRNTAPCIGLAAAVIEKLDPQAVMMVLPADHYINEVDKYVQVLKAATTMAAHEDALITIGIKPNRPETGYGYIQVAQPEGLYQERQAYRVEAFVEKPHYERAVEYLSSGQYLWNSGMFVWNVRAIRQAIQQFLPALDECIEALQAVYGTEQFDEVLQREYAKTEKTSIDFGVMENAQAIYVFPGDFGWDDVGAWPALNRLRPTDEHNNVVEGNVITQGTKDSIIIGGERLIAVVGVKDLVVVDTDDVLLLCDTQQAQVVKQALEQLKRRGLEQYL